VAIVNEMLRRRSVALPLLLATPLTVVLLTACNGYGASSDRSEPSITCDEVLASVVHRERTGDTAGSINEEFDWLSRNCSSEYEVATDYVSMKGTAEQFGPEACDSLTRYIGRESIALLSEDGLCTGDSVEASADRPADVPVEESQPGGGIAWDEALDYAGADERVCGPLAGIGNSDDDVFLNLGRDYPDPERFQIVLWDIGGVEYIPYGTTLCTSGQITLYEGVAQIQLRSASQVEIYE
jgi:hypothetical protein